MRNIYLCMNFQQTFYHKNNLYNRYTDLLKMKQVFITLVIFNLGNRFYYDNKKTNKYYVNFFENYVII